MVNALIELRDQTGQDAFRSSHQTCPGLENEAGSSSNRQRGRDLSRLQSCLLRGWRRRRGGPEVTGRGRGVARPWIGAGGGGDEPIHL